MFNKTVVLAAALWLLSGTASGQGTAPWDKYGDRITAAQDIPKLGDDLFGDEVSLMNGGLSFSATDVSLPGNGPAVSLGRRYSVQNWRYRAPTEVFGDWEADVPKISGIYLGDWVDSAGGTARCSTGGAPAQHASKGVVAFDYWQGLSISIPGVTGGEMLEILDTAPKPDTGEYRYVTNDHVRISCLTSIKNGTGQGFLAITPDGTKYWFDWLAKHPEAPLRRGTKLYYDTTPQGILVPREHHIQSFRQVLYATRVEDRFGNVVSYEYSPEGDNGIDDDSDENSDEYGDADGPGRLLRIVSGSLVNGVVVGGDGRQIKLKYTDGWATSVSDGTGRTWTYGYGVTDEGRRTLTRVTQPSGDSWLFALKEFTDAELEYDESPDYNERSCLLEHLPQNIQDTPTATITHPSGAVGTFVTSIVRHNRTNVPLACVNVRTGDLGGNDPTDDVPLIPVSHDQFSLKSKSISASSIPTATWSYAYASNRWWYNPNGGQFQNPYVCSGALEFCAQKPPCTAHCNSVATTLVVGPGNGWTRYSHGNHYRQNEGLLVKVETGSGSTVSTTVDAFGRPSNALRVVTNSYEIDPAGGCTVQWGEGMREGDEYANECPRPLLETVTWQQGVNFRRKIEAKDAYAMPTTVLRSSEIAPATTTETATALYSRRDHTTYLHDTSRWVLGLVTSEWNGDLDWVTVSTVHDLANRKTVHYWPHAVGEANPAVRQTLAYNTNGTLATVTDGRDHVTTLSAWHRGVPQRIDYPDATYEQGTVNDRGEITGVRNQAGFTTTYRYDTRGMIDLVTYPTDTPAWNATTRTFGKTSTVQLQLPVGTWYQTVKTGTGVKTTYFDALWRPIVSREVDTAVAGTTRFNAWEYDAAGNTIFTAYPLASAANRDSFQYGVHTTFDALGRATSVAQDNGPGAPALVTLTAYLAPFQTRVTNPRGLVTRTWFHVLDRPDMSRPSDIRAPESVRTRIWRDAIGRTTRVQRSDLADSTRAFNRDYRYGRFGLLERSYSPEERATYIDYDDAGNAIATYRCRFSGDVACGWTAEGGRPSEVATRTFDEMNRVTLVDYPSGTTDVASTYTPDGLLESTTVGSVQQQYEYNSRRQITEERLLWGSIDRSVDHTYDANGHAASIQGPGGPLIDFAPNALGQATRAGTFATGAQYFPNGALKQFTYGNGVVHVLTQNARGLPETSVDEGPTTIVDDTYEYDDNGNVAGIVDGLPGGPGTRSMTYDDLDRLTGVTALPAQGGKATFDYDVMDNIVRLDQGNSLRRHQYDSYNRLVALNTDTGTPIATYGYDYHGNINKRTRGGLEDTFTFDAADRLMSSRVGDATGTGAGGVASTYVYNGLGHRVRENVAGVSTYATYTQAGKLVHTANSSETHHYVYLAGSLVADRKTAGGVTTTRYQHTNALGSPIATSDELGGDVQYRRETAYGEPVAGWHEGPGFTGHEMDATTKLVYMQQRYYDPIAGRFLSADPLPTASDTGSNFNRYLYGAGNPYKFVDPDGRQVCKPFDGGEWKSCAKPAFPTPNEGRFDLASKSEEGTERELSTGEKIGRNLAWIGDSIGVEFWGGWRAGAHLNLARAEAEFSLGEAKWGVGFTLGDAYIFTDTAGGSVGGRIGKLGLGYFGGEQRSLIGRHDGLYAEENTPGGWIVVTPRGNANFGADFRSDQISVGVGVILGADVTVDMGKLTVGLFYWGNSEIDP